METGSRRPITETGWRPGHGDRMRPDHGDRITETHYGDRTETGSRRPDSQRPEEDRTRKHAHGDRIVREKRPGGTSTETGWGGHAGSNGLGDERYSRPREARSWAHRDCDLRHIDRIIGAQTGAGS